MKFFKISPNINRMSNEYAEAITKYSIQGINTLKKMCFKFVNLELEEEHIITEYLEFNTYLLHILDKLASKKYGNIFRSKFVNKTLDKVKQNFFRTFELGEDFFQDKNKVKNDLFETFFKTVFLEYPREGSIIGDDQTNVTLKLAERLINNVHRDITKPENEVMQIYLS